MFLFTIKSIATNYAVIGQWLLGGKGWWFTLLGTSLSLEKYCFACCFLQIWAFFSASLELLVVWLKPKNGCDVTMKYEDCINSWCRRASEYLEDTLIVEQPPKFSNIALEQKMVLCKIKIGVFSSFYKTRGVYPPFSLWTSYPTLASSVKLFSEAFDGHFHPGYLDPLHVPGWFEVCWANRLLERDV